MNFNNDDELTRGLRELGKGTPFPVDWQEYDARFARRLLLYQRARQRSARRVGIVCGVGGAAAGALLSAAAILSLVLLPLRPGGLPAEPTRPVVMSEARLGESEADTFHVLSGTSAATIGHDGAITDRPFYQRHLREDGTLSEIRFDGFSAPNSAQGLIAGRAETN